MADYPFLYQGMGTTDESFDDLTIDRASDGTGYARALFNAPKARFTLRHILDATQMQTLMDFYNTYRLTTFGFTFTRGPSDTTYYPSMLFESRPRLTLLGAGLVQAEVKVAEK